MQLYNFLGATGSGMNPADQAGMEQYNQQGQLGINPGAVNVQNADPIAATSRANFGQLLAHALQSGNGQPGQTAAGQPPLMQQAAQMQAGPNMMGPPQASDIQGPPQPPQGMLQQIGNALSNLKTYQQFPKGKNGGFDGMSVGDEDYNG